MTAIEIAEPGGPEQLRIASRPVPVPGHGEVLVRVEAAGVNRPDILQRMGRYPPPPGVTDIPGLEIAGSIVALGEKVGDWNVGDRVCALVAGGGYAEFCAAPAGLCLAVPLGWPMVDAAAVPETFFTVWTNVFDRGRLARGDTLLVHGGASGIGTAAIAMGRAFGARVLVTAGGPAKCRACEQLGADRAIDHQREDFVDVVRSVTTGRGADVILDMVGGDYVPRNLEALAEDGRLVQIAFLRGSRAEVDLQAVMRKRLTLTGSTLRARALHEKCAIADALRREVWPRLERGEIRPVVHATFPLEEAANAHRRMESGTHVGKIVLVVAVS